MKGRRRRKIYGRRLKENPWFGINIHILLAACPKFLEKRMGLPALYAVHGVTVFVLLAVTFSHKRVGMPVSSQFASLLVVRPTGSLSVLLFLLATVAGIFVLSGALNDIPYRSSGMLPVSLLTFFFGSQIASPRYCSQVEESPKLILLVFFLYIRKGIDR